MVYHKTRRQHTQFRKLPFGYEYWVNGTLNVSSSTKRDRSNALTGWSADGSPTLTPVTPTTTEVVRVPVQFSKRSRL